MQVIRLKASAMNSTRKHLMSSKTRLTWWSIWCMYMSGNTN